MSWVHDLGRPSPHHLYLVLCRMCDMLTDVWLGTWLVGLAFLFATLTVE